MDHLKCILEKESTRQKPNKPPLELPTRKPLPILGEQTPDAMAMDADQRGKEVKFVSNAENMRGQREKEGLGDLHGLNQRWGAPDMDATLVGAKTEVCCECHVDGGGKLLAWCEGAVMNVANETKVPMKWKANEERGENESFSRQELKKRKWNPSGKHTKGSWRCA